LILTVNAATSAMLGYSEDDLVGQPLSLLLPPGDSLLQRMGPLELVQERAVRGLEKTYLAADGRAIPVMFSAAVMRDPHGDVAGIVSLAQDLTQRKAFEKELSRLAFHDALSNLPNRALFLDRLEHALVRSERTRVPVAVLFLDLDNFKVVNDSLGHQTGDRLLMIVADRLRECLRAEDTAARFGGDEFTVLVEDVADGVEAMAVAERIGETLRAPISLDGHEVFPSASIGIAISTVGVDDPDSLLRNADLAMYRAKTGGKSRCEVFDLSMNAGVMERLELEGDLRRAMARGELELHYQPIKSLASGRIVEVEALLRWTHPLRGSIPPDQFVPLAEETGLIVPLGQWVLETACRQAQLWQAEVPGRLAPIMSVNLSARQFQHRTLVEDIDRVLRETGLDPRQLTLEITESVVMHDAESTAATLRRLKGLGIGLAIDDFETGYSSLSYLKRFPVDTLKIDRSFVDGLGDEGHDTAIVHSVIALAKSLHLAVTAEGIETAAQLEHLQRLGCDRGQGFYFSAAVPPERLSALLTANPVGRPIHGPRRAGVA
ncbi:MAG: EAL domain-containing protein, partial [Chloroflexi bacterium]|nr:EAL domain-containing protein [Chloroflexota bacterium]